MAADDRVVSRSKQGLGIIGGFGLALLRLFLPIKVTREDMRMQLGTGREKQGCVLFSFRLDDDFCMVRRGMVLHTTKITRYGMEMLCHFYYNAKTRPLFLRHA